MSATGGGHVPISTITPGLGRVIVDVGAATAYAPGMTHHGSDTARTA